LVVVIEDRPIISAEYHFPLMINTDTRGSRTVSLW